MIMKRGIIVFAFMLFSLMVFTGCNNTESTGSYVLSAEKVAYGNRIYSIEIINQNGAFLAYTEIGDETGEIHHACIDPLCSHEKDECIAMSNSTIRDIAIVPKSKGCIIYYFRIGKDPDGYVANELMALDMHSGKCSRVTVLPALAYPSRSYMITDEYVYFSMHIPDETNKQSINIFRAPLMGGDLEQMTFAEDTMTGYLLEHYEDGYLYYRRGDHLYKTVDFTTEEPVFEMGNFNLIWDLVFHDGWMYYADDFETEVYKPDEEIPDGYSNVYGYSNEAFVSALDSANRCSVKRMKLDGSSEIELVVSGVTPPYNSIGKQLWCIVDNILYCVPSSFEYQGKIDWSVFFSQNSLTYIWSETGGDLLAVDLDTKEVRQVLTDTGYDITGIEYTGNGNLMIYGRIYDMDKLTEHYQTNEIKSGSLKLDTWYLMDIDDLK